MSTPLNYSTSHPMNGLEPVEARQIFINDISGDTTTSDLRNLFAAAGKVTNVEIDTNELNRHFAFVTFESSQGVQSAISKFTTTNLNNTTLVCRRRTQLEQMRQKRMIDARCKLFVGNIPQQMGPGELKREIERLSGRPVKDFRHKKGYCFVGYNTPQDAEDAKRNLKNAICGGKSLNAEFKKEDPIRNEPGFIAVLEQAQRTLYVRDIPPNTSPDNFKNIFEHYGKVRKFTLPTETRSNKLIGYAFIEYFWKEDCDKALQQTEALLIDGVHIEIRISDPPKDKPSGGYDSHRRGNRRDNRKDGMHMRGGMSRDRNRNNDNKYNRGGNDRNRSRFNRNRSRSRSRSRSRDRNNHSKYHHNGRTQSHSHSHPHSNTTNISYNARNPSAIIYQQAPNVAYTHNTNPSANRYAPVNTHPHTHTHTLNTNPYNNMNAHPYNPYGVQVQAQVIPTQQGIQTNTINTTANNVNNNNTNGTQVSSNPSGTVVTSGTVGAPNTSYPPNPYAYNYGYAYHNPYGTAALAQAQAQPIPTSNNTSANTASTVQSNTTAPQNNSNAAQQGTLKVGTSGAPQVAQAAYGQPYAYPPQTAPATQGTKVEPTTVASNTNINVPSGAPVTSQGGNTGAYNYYQQPNAYAANYYQQQTANINSNQTQIPQPQTQTQQYTYPQQGSYPYTNKRY